MKKIIPVFILLFISLASVAQRNAIDEMFDKYSGRDGITTVYISSKMFSMMARVDLDDEELQDVIKNLKTIRILTVEDQDLNDKLDFFSELSGQHDFSDYEELMVVKESGKNLKFLVKEKGKRIDELLMIGGGPGQNVLISIKGDLDLDNISSISRTMGIKELQNGIDY
ncbi:MAG TPA: DUF4252 domain-containing protein [Bacteroidales bacterium]|nr:DUF4252 domain-containing protein [Bacteroidales bacterium]